MNRAKLVLNWAVHTHWKGCIEESGKKGTRKGQGYPRRRRAVNSPRTHFPPRDGHQLPIKELPPASLNKVHCIGNVGAGREDM